MDLPESLEELFVLEVEIYGEDQEGGGDSHQQHDDQDQPLTGAGLRLHCWCPVCRQWSSDNNLLANSRSSLPNCCHWLGSAPVPPPSPPINNSQEMENFQFEEIEINRQKLQPTIAQRLSWRAGVVRCILREVGLLSPHVAVVLYCRSAELPINTSLLHTDPAPSARLGLHYH